MKFNISPDIIDQASNCREKMSCLTGSKNCLCNANDYTDSKVIFVDLINLKTCDYKISYGYSHICTCPVRKWIYVKYKK